MAEPAARMLAAVLAIAQAADRSRQDQAGSVRLTASEVVSVHVLPPILVRLAQRHPEIQVELVASDRVDNLLEREADIAVRMVRPQQGGVITRHIGDWPLGLYAHRDLLTDGEPTRATLSRFRLLGFDQSMQIIDGFRAAGLGIGIALVPLARRQPQLVRVLANETLPSLPVWLTARQELRANLRLRRVFDLLAVELRRWAAGKRSGPRSS